MEANCRTVGPSVSLRGLWSKAADLDEENECPFGPLDVETTT
ncbi:hypothetical protein RSSM_00219 [Rhodopirellula sallentina SM41]|uniref:Uncharacterized protein n=1 Tax=Rhodopirellula sallentina SM41 TaxID=1263870 RepID=M5UA69_9BACT|nr:hypothetical protein RSSM_00219 [Rhodopirellula sallentina SM41]